MRARWLAAALLLVGCEAAAPTTAQPTPAVWWHSGDPPPAAAKQPWSVDADTERFAFMAGSPSVASREEQILSILRRNLRRRRVAPELVTGPTVVVPSREHPDAELAIAGPEEAELARSWPPSAALVLTGAGRWWVWEYGSIAPADALARQLQTDAGTRGL